MTGRMRRWLVGADAGGSPAIEMGLVLPLLLFMIGVALEFGIVMFQVMEVNNAVEAGAAYAAAHQEGCCNSGYNTKIQSVVQNATALTVTAATPSSFCGCPNNANPPAVMSATCGTICSFGTGNRQVGKYVTVSASYNLVSSIVPWLPNNGQLLPSSISFSTTVRVQ